MAVPRNLDLLDVLHLATPSAKIIVGLIQRVAIRKVPADGILSEGDLTWSQLPQPQS